MDIQFDKKNRVFKLDTEHTSYVMAVVDNEGFLGHVYYGAKISDTDVAYLLRTDENPMVQSLYEGLLKGKTHELLHRNFAEAEKEKNK